MNARFVSVCFSLAGLMIAASPGVLAQRGGGHGGGMSGGMGGGVGSGMSSGIQRGGSMDTMPAGRPSERMGGASQQDSKLSEGLAKLLPAGTNLQTAAAGFKNLGEFVAAVHVSHNLGIPFADLKAKIMGGDSLGEAIHALRPNADAQVEARKARAKAEDDIGSS